MPFSDPGDDGSSSQSDLAGTVSRIQSVASTRGRGIPPRENSSPSEEPAPPEPPARVRLDRHDIHRPVVPGEQQVCQREAEGLLWGERDRAPKKVGGVFIVRKRQAEREVPVSRGLGDPHVLLFDRSGGAEATGGDEAGASTELPFKPKNAGNAPRALSRATPLPFAGLSDASADLLPFMQPHRPQVPREDPRRLRDTPHRRPAPGCA